MLNQLLYGAKLATFPTAPAGELETRPVLKKLTLAHRALAELKGVLGIIPTEEILLNTLPLQEAKDSSAVENIITTHDELFRAELRLEELPTQATKEVQNYAAALGLGFELVQTQGFLSVNQIARIQAELEHNNAGYRRLPGTTLKNQQTGEVVFTPPQDYDTIMELMGNLEQYLNDDSLSDADPLVKMAVLHFQFESVHPFYDGNGRTGRILNILYLVLKGLLELPVFYLSRYLIRHKADYYRLLQHVRDTGEWEPWLLYMLTGIEQTARETIRLINDMRQLMQHTRQRLREYKFYSQDLLNNLFRHPYTKIEFVQQELGVSRLTAASYLNQLAAPGGLLQKYKLGKSNYYVNQPLFDLLARLA
ncbi:Fic family protein [Hymenobacter actinosclerus]|uniref:Fic family protein n=1 Tax=Hymenobacter actinosclerus TaxID=82805 RepID=A0A1I0J020_9BACT|nr:Fic family protein [Hymenobacter actinosclerus]SEU03076.1 Fic family protein [Hymenobacter actinosclerus]